jgi:excisionase family DNA binding protein
VTPPVDVAAAGLLDALVESVADRVIAAVGERPAPADPETALALTPSEAAGRLGMSETHFRRHVMHELRIVRSGRLRLVPIAELRGWLEQNAARTLDGAPLAHGSAKPHGKRDSDSVQGDAPWGES